MKKVIAGIGQWVFYLVYYLLTGSVAARMIPHYIGTDYQWVVIFLVAAFILLLSSERIISRFIKWYIYFYFLIQLGIISALLVIPTDTAPTDYFLNLVLPLCGQVMWTLNDPPARYWIVAFSFYCFLAMMLSFDLWEGMGFGFTYIAGCILVSVLSAATLRSNRAQIKSQALLAELQIANQKLQEYSRQVESLAAAEERNRLARELHDSVSQTIFSMTLTAQAARMLMESDPPRVPSLLDHLQTLSHNALAEMRTLIQELRPHNIVYQGLAAALQKHVKDRLLQDGLKVDVQILKDRRLSNQVEEGLFRVAQEALNNVVKHSGSDTARIILDLGSDTRCLIIEDQGIGFDPLAVRSLPGHVGLSSMDERVRSFGGTLMVDAKPGGGTRIRIENIPINDDDNSNSSDSASDVPRIVEG